MTTYRLMDGLSGRPGNGPGSPAAYSGNFLAGILWKVTSGGLWLSGYWHWVPAGGDTTARKFALWQLTDTTHSVSQVLVPAGTITSGTLTAGQWNYVPLSTPIALPAGVPYVACYGYSAVNGFPDTQNQFGSGNPYAAGITNGPLFAYSDQGASAPEPYTSNYSQGVFSVASTDPAAVMPSTGDVHSNFWVDVQVTDVPPAGASYRLWPNQQYATGWVDDTADNFTLGCEFTLATSCTLSKIWFYSQAGVTQLPTECGIWRVATQALVAGTDNASPSWSGAAGSGWVSVSYAGITLLAGNYKVAVLNAAGTPAIWNPTTNFYWGIGVGAGGISNGPLSAPDTSHATSPGQDTYNLGSLFIYPLTYAPGAAGANYWVDVEVTPVSTQAQAGLATGSGMVPSGGVVQEESGSTLQDEAGAQVLQENGVFTIAAAGAAAGLASGAGTARTTAFAYAPAGLAHADGIAPAPSVIRSGGTNAMAGIAAGTGTAQQPLIAGPAGLTALTISPTRLTLAAGAVTRTLAVPGSTGPANATLPAAGATQRTLNVGPVTGEGGP